MAPHCVEYLTMLKRSRTLAFRQHGFLSVFCSPLFLGGTQAVPYTTAQLKTDSAFVDD